MAVDSAFRLVTRPGAVVQWTTVALTALALTAPAAQADEPPDEARPSGASSTVAIDRTWLYVDDARVAAPMTVIATSSVSYTDATGSPSRILGPDDAPSGCTSPCSTYHALAANTATPGLMLQVGGEVGILPRLSAIAIAQLGMGGSDIAPNRSLGALAGLRLDPLPTSVRDVHLALSAGYLRESWQGPSFDDATDTWRPGSPSGANGVWARAAVSGELRRVRMAATVHAEHVFADGRDGVDVMVQLGATYRAIGGLRLGAEYVGQDLEETFSPEAEGGARHILGPVASLQLADDRLTLVTGPALGLSAQAPSWVYRLAASYGF